MLIMEREGLERGAFTYLNGDEDEAILVQGAIMTTLMGSGTRDGHGQSACREELVQMAARDI